MYEAMAAEIALAIMAEIVAVRHNLLTAQELAIYPRSFQQEQQHV
jgi:xanthine/CO dehydrogenase XdhC/CoxF family maturation factor